MIELDYLRAEQIRDRLRFLAEQKRIIALGSCWRTEGTYHGGLDAKLVDVAREAIERQIDLEAVTLEKEFKEL